ncbi:LpxI family protein [Novispirillum sp. DQ9]|uniref:LpxI family protein n=1 Tax=Novispirillum sp. DQ9 TaxID=3398612 RepID=UPI003C7C58EB
MTSEPAPPKLGIIAGGGDLPGRLIAACRRDGRPFFVLALEGFAEPSVIGDAPHEWVRLGAAGEGFRILHAHRVSQVVMAGRVRRPSLADLRPDWRAARLFARIGLKALGDDGLLRAVVQELEGEGFGVVGADDILGEEILAPEGVLGAHRPDDQALADVAHGVRVARGLGALDVGQGAVVQQGLVLAVEAIEGTDAMLGRCAALRRDGPGGVLVKTAKPAQERRADLPTIGVATVDNAHAAGLRGIAVQAGGALMVDKAGIIARADALGLFVFGVRVGDE